MNITFFHGRLVAVAWWTPNASTQKAFSNVHFRCVVRKIEATDITHWSSLPDMRHGYFGFLLYAYPEIKGIMVPLWLFHLIGNPFFYWLTHRKIVRQRAQNSVVVPASENVVARGHSVQYWHGDKVETDRKSARLILPISFVILLIVQIVAYFGGLFI